MMERIKALPFFVLLMGLAAPAMMVIAFHALGRSDYTTSRIYLYGALLTSFLTLLIGLATGGYAPRSVARSQLTALLAAFSLLPVVFAVPFYVAVGNTSFLNAWFEMVSSFTTTGATIYDNAGRLNSSLHLWRALVGWLGGLLLWITAIAILAPMNLGGFEVRATSAIGEGTRGGGQPGRSLDPSDRLTRHALQLTPVYAGLTLVLWLGLIFAGDRSLVALCHAMSIMATSGISPIGGLQNAPSGVGGEAIILVFLLLALTRLPYSRDLSGEQRMPLHRDPELRLGLALVVSVTMLLFLRHFMASFEEDTNDSFFDALRALWGGLFTVLSFLTTTGFESRHWLGAADWSGLGTPGLVLLGLSLIGGGVATTAGGVKLLRVYALYKHGQRELDRLIHPHSVGGAGPEARHIRRQGAYIAWIFFMLFALSIAGVMLALSLTGVQFETAVVLAVAALSTTGPLAYVAAENAFSYAGLPDMAKGILAAAMVLGRLETLAIIALLNPEFWRN